MKLNSYAIKCVVSGHSVKIDLPNLICKNYIEPFLIQVIKSGIEIFLCPPFVVPKMFPIFALIQQYIDSGLNNVIMLKSCHLAAIKYCLAFTRTREELSVLAF